MNSYVQSFECTCTSCSHIRHIHITPILKNKWRHVNICIRSNGYSSGIHLSLHQTNIKSFLALGIEPSNPITNIQNKTKLLKILFKVIWIYEGHLCIYCIYIYDKHVLYLLGYKTRGFNCVRNHILVLSHIFHLIFQIRGFNKCVTTFLA